MTRHGYVDDCDDNLQLGRWRAQVKSAMRGKRGQKLLREILAALDAMPDKRLIKCELVKDGECCVLGAVALHRGMDVSAVDPEDQEQVAETFDIAHAMACEIMYENDEVGVYWGPQVNVDVDAQRWTHMRKWVERHITTQEAQR